MEVVDGREPFLTDYFLPIRLWLPLQPLVYDGKTRMETGYLRSMIPMIETWIS